VKTASRTRVRMDNQERWAQITLSLLEPFGGGQFLHYPEDFSCQIQGADDLAATYDLKNWESGVMSGAFYAFRRLKRPRVRILVSEMVGFLRSEDMPALALASTIGVTELLEADVSPLQMPGWRFGVHS
jgi:hypothetical protein